MFEDLNAFQFAMLSLVYATLHYWGFTGEKNFFLLFQKVFDKYKTLEHFIIDNFR